MIITNSRYALVGYFITSYPTRAHGIIVIKTLIDCLRYLRVQNRNRERPGYLSIITQSGRTLRSCGRDYANAMQVMAFHHL